MPTYSYYCKNCGYECTHWQKISDPHLVECPSCSEKSYCRRISAPSFSLKGSGWYATDFCAPGASSSKSAESKTDSKPTADKDKPIADAPNSAKKDSGDGSE
ncbi:FmdB family zinc ribbon protein [Candidatus Ichthyocystis hellenicum]|uniref:FmdB family zinc ribbon protein n=1 Tax=Candidatus Ichthyocystis hellenicum TaxID=1561003 RepID=UPI000ADAE747|nr:zinc ribbon domain-containing protein [Candidatus Ichthyocystis hellenicum]